MNEKLKGAVGFCRRAGKITIGTVKVCEKLKEGKIALVISAKDTAKNSLMKVSNLAVHKGVEVITADITKAELGKAVGADREINLVGIPKEFLNMVLHSI